MWRAPPAQQRTNHTHSHSSLRRTRHERGPAQWQPAATVIPLRLMLLAPPFSRILRQNCRALEWNHLVTNDLRLARRSSRCKSLCQVREGPLLWSTTDRNSSTVAPWMHAGMHPDGAAMHKCAKRLKLLQYVFRPTELLGSVAGPHYHNFAHLLRCTSAGRLQCVCSANIRSGTN
jgi:hypothetical protein